MVLGAHGFIGAAVVRALRDDGHAVTGLGRSAPRTGSEHRFVARDLTRMTEAADWAPVLEDTDLVVNCAGALQDRHVGELEAVHHRAIAALARAASGRGIGVVQISAVGASARASTEFMRSKARGDAALAAADVSLWLLRPGLVLGQGAFGGTLLLRMLAAVPLVQPMALARAQVQSVALEDVARVVVEAVNGSLPPGQYDLVEDTPQSLRDVIGETRRWLGFEPARLDLEMPGWAVTCVAAVADGLGRLGWRSPLRSTAIRVLQDGVTGDPAPRRAARGQGMRSLNEIYASLYARREERLAARMALAMPLAVGVLSLFWVISGLIGLWQIDRAAETLTQVGWSGGAAMASVAFWALVDVGLGLAILWRRWAGRACLGMVAVSLIYLISGAMLTPHLWSDPLGPMVKVVPGALLALITHQLLEER